ncbi:MAG: MBG domain-containing protein, partial [Syntrophorhabdus sp.]
NDYKLYNNNPYSGGNGVTYTGFVAGEGPGVLGGSLYYGGTSQGAVSRGIYSIDPLGLSANNYSIGFVSGSLVIAQNTNTAQSTIDAVLTSRQNNGQGHAPSFVSPGIAVTGKDAELVMQGSDILSFGPHSIPIAYKTSGKTLTLFNDKQGMNEQVTVPAGTILVYIRTAGGSSALKGSYLVGLGDKAISIRAVPWTDRVPAPIPGPVTVTFSVYPQKGPVLNTSASISKGGVLIIDTPHEIDAANIDRVILAALDVLHHEFGLEPETSVE